MKEIIYLRVSRRKVEGMTKSLPNLYAGEIPVKLTINVEDAAFREPTIDREVVIEDWREGIDLADVEFQENTITEDEAKQIRKQRLERMKEILENQGYQITKSKETE